MSQANLTERPYINSNLFSSHYLDERVGERDEWDCDDKAREAMEELQSQYDLEGELVSGYGEDALIDNWIDEVLDALGFGTQEEVTLPAGGGFVDELLFETPPARRDAASVYLDTKDTTDLFQRGVGLVEAKQWDADFTQRFSEQRPYRNASHQIKHYLEKTPGNIQWGVLTNGRKWRLYGTKDYETQTYYEVDLPELLERGDLDAFKYFFVFFRPAAFRESAGTRFLDEVWSESETASQELGEDLQDNVFTALRVLGRGFIETNDLDINPDDEDALDELKDQSLVLLYRLMFVLYAEARGLIHPEGQAAQDEYERNFSLDDLRLDIHETIGEVDEGFGEEFSEYSTGMWSRLEDLFRLIDEGEESLGIPPYNGGLFDHDEHDFLTEHEVSNRYLAEVIYRLSTTQNGDGRYVLADYADLDTRHLGSVYEGLLEHQFRIAPEQYAAVAGDGGQVWKPSTKVTVADAVETVPKGGLYVVNDEGERKATGAYYTPDYVVTYIVEETVGPLVEEIREDLIEQGFEPGNEEYLGPFSQRVTDLKILDPAMGSGHFLTKATGYLAEQVMEEVREVETELGVAFDEQHIRREIAKECIYGVDLNGMAVELAKLSMWLETLAAERPLAFLDHHFKHGNSLVGSDIESIEELESDVNGDDSQYSLAEFGATREGTIEHLMDVYSEFLAIENETVADVREMKRKYAEIEQDELRGRLVAMANVHTAEQFDVDVPSGAYERMAKALEDDEEWVGAEETNWFTRAQSMADTYGFFHWQLAFPEVFYEQDGSIKKEAGFDTVIGNPPYIRVQTLNQNNPKMSDYLSSTFETAIERFDIYSCFVEQAGSIANSFNVGYILPNRFFQSDAGRGLRRLVTNVESVRKIVDFHRFQVFPGVTTYTCILLLNNSQSETEYKRIVSNPKSVDDLRNANGVDIPLSKLSDNKWTLVGPKENQVLEKMKEIGKPLQNLTTDVFEGIVTGDNTILYPSLENRDGELTTILHPENKDKIELESEVCLPLVKGDDIKRYDTLDPELCVIYPYDKSGNLISESVLKEDYPRTYDYLTDFRDELEDRGTDNMSYQSWYALYRDRERRQFESKKVVTPDICEQCEFSLDEEGDAYLDATSYGIIPENNTPTKRAYLAAILNSSTIWFYISNTSARIRGGFYRFKTSYLNPVPVPDVEQIRSIDDIEINEPLNFDIDINSQNNKILSGICAKLAQRQRNQTERRKRINLSLLDYLGTYSDAVSLTDIGIYQPPEGVGKTKLTATTEDHRNIRVGTVTCEREDENTVVVHATARYKPDDEDAYKTDQWGYTETEPMPAIRLTDLSETEADLVEAFVPVAVEEAGGFAGFRETATKTNSLVDRLEAITLPDPDDVAEDLERYREAVERAEKLDEKIQQTDDLIDEIVYELYGLSDEEINIVEESVSAD